MKRRAKATSRRKPAAVNPARAKAKAKAKATTTTARPTQPTPLLLPAEPEGIGSLGDLLDQVGKLEPKLPKNV